jgi:hypothetical protein
MYFYKKDKSIFVISNVSEGSSAIRIFASLVEEDFSLTVEMTIGIRENLSKK